MSVIGHGRSRPAPGGNGYLVTRDRSGRQVRTDLWIESIQTDLSLLISKAQLRTRVSHRPVRLQERYVGVRALMPGFAAFYALGDTIRDHWAWNLGSGAPRLMVLRYYGANKRYRGLVEKVSAGETRFEVLKVAEMRLRVVMEPEQGATIQGPPSPFSPTDADVRLFGRDWWRATALQSDAQRARGAPVDAWASGGIQ